MEIVQLLKKIKTTSGTNDKKSILEENKDNDLLKKVLLYGLDPFTPFNVVKVPKTKTRYPAETEATRWDSFFNIADLCANRTYTGNFAIQMMSDAFCIATEEEEKWMRKILKKHLAIGASTKSVNKVFPNLVPTFEVSLAQKFEMKRIDGMDVIAIEPKLDGIRCFAIVQEGRCQLFARSGKLIPNFDNTIGAELLKLGDGCYDGELMGEDFISIMRQAYRKEDVNTSGTYLAVFDYLPLSEWKSGSTEMSCHDRFETLLDMLYVKHSCIDHNIIRPVERQYLTNPTFEEIKEVHDEYIKEGFEGAMIKDMNAPYRFGRGFEVMKLKAFLDADIVIKYLTEGTGKHAGKLGSVTAEFEGVEVSIGSGFSDELRERIWSDKDSFIGRTIEVRYQEVTPDGSLRFPTFVCFRNDRD